MRYTTFRFALAPTPTQEARLARHAGASRFAYNQCLELVSKALDARQVDAQISVPWSGFDLINAFNRWKSSEEAGRLFVVAANGIIDKQVTGLRWRHEVSAQVFEEAAVDYSRALAAVRASRTSAPKRWRVQFPKRTCKGRSRDSFRIRNKQHKRSAWSIRVEGHPRSVTLPTIGQISVHDDTRRLRRLLRPVKTSDVSTGTDLGGARAKILFATITRHSNRWYVSLNMQASNLHPERRHPVRVVKDGDRFVGVDRGLTVFAVAATAEAIEVGRFHAPRPLKRRLVLQP